MKVGYLITMGNQYIKIYYCEVTGPDDCFTYLVVAEIVGFRKNERDEKISFY
jgi:hypothetical protein